MWSCINVRTVELPDTFCRSAYVEHVGMHCMKPVFGDWSGNFVCDVRYVMRTCVLNSFEFCHTDEFVASDLEPCTTAENLNSDVAATAQPMYCANAKCVSMSACHCLAAAAHAATASISHRVTVDLRISPMIAIP